MSEAISSLIRPKVHADPDTRRAALHLHAATAVLGTHLSAPGSQEVTDAPHVTSGSPAYSLSISVNTCSIA